jgi:DDE superfamily endonuclease
VFIIIIRCCRVIEPTHRGMRYEFLPPYSPDYNPIEHAFSAIKAYLRQHGDLVRAATIQTDDTDVYVRLHEAVWSVMPADAEGWFANCGY